MKGRLTGLAFLRRRSALALSIKGEAHRGLAKRTTDLEELFGNCSKRKRVAGKLISTVDKGVRDHHLALEKILK